MPIAEIITITVGDEAIELRPSLRFALPLARREGSFAGLLRDIMDGSLSAAVEIIAHHTDMHFLENRVFDVLPDLREPLLSYVMACTGIEPDDAADPSPAKKSKAKSAPASYGEYLTSLYKIGTGWLGWTPAQTLDATPAEINLAYEGRLEMLKVIFGSKEDAPKDTRPWDEKARGIFAGLGAVSRE